MPGWTRVATLGCMGLGIAGAALAQTTSAPGADEHTIALHVEVSARHDQPVTGLTQADFTVLDNGVATPIQTFRVESAAQQPVAVYVLLDDVNNSFQTVAYEQAQVQKFLLANDGRLACPTTLALLTDIGFKVSAAPTRNGKALQDALSKETIPLRDITRSTGFYGAGERADLSLRALQQFADHVAAQPGRKLLLWISTGWPLLSGPEVQLAPRQEQGIFDEIVHFSTLLRQADITVYNINPVGAQEDVQRQNYFRAYVKGVSKPNQATFGALSLQVLAEQSGGLTYLGRTDIDGMLKDAEADAVGWYEIHIPAQPAERPNTYHHLEVHVDKPGVTVRALQGYYAQP